MSILIKGGTVFTAAESFHADILIENGKISKLGKNLATEDKVTTYDAQGMEIYPGGIDPHTHLGLVLAGQKSPDDFHKGTIAALKGGTTTVLDYVVPTIGESLLTAFHKWSEEAEGKSSVDYGAHMSLVGFPDFYSEEIPQLKELGIGTLKCFGGYKGRNMQDDEQFLNILEISKELSYLVLLHSENGHIISFLEKKLQSNGMLGPEFHHLAHPSWGEGESTYRAIKLAEFTEVPLYIVHISCLESAEVIANARLSGLPIMGETCPQYLLLCSDVYEQGGLKAAKFVLTPPLRESFHHQELWRYLKNGVIQVLATDNASYSTQQKAQGINNFMDIPNGLPSVGLRVPLLYTYGVQTGRLSRNRFVELVATNPAKIFGLYPQKGGITIGGDADLMVIDPSYSYTLTDENDPHAVDYSAYKGFQIDCGMKYVFLRGKLVVENGEFVGKAGQGHYIRSPGLEGMQIV